MRKSASIISARANLALALSLLLAPPVFAAVASTTEEDGSPDCYGWRQKFSNGSVTDNGDGTCSVAGLGDITAVGDQASGAAFNAVNTGTTLTFSNPTSGTIALTPVTGALGTVTLRLPAATDTLVGKATTDTLTNKTLVAADNVINADTAVVLATARTIGGTSFDGSANIAIGALNSTNVGATTSLELLGVLSDETGTGAAVFGTSPTVALGANSTVQSGANPTVDAAGEIGQDTTDDQFLYGATPRVIPYERPVGIVIEDLAATDDNYAFYMANDAITITAVGCNCRGTCTTPATFTLEDRGGNAMTITGTNPTCATTGAATFAAVTAGGGLTAGEMVAFDVTNTPTANDEYALFVTYTVDRQ